MRSINRRQSCDTPKSGDRVGKSFIKLCLKGSSLLGIIFKEVYSEIDFLERTVLWNKLKKKLEIIFKEELSEISVRDKYNAAIAYGLSGDVRLEKFENTFVEISSGSYYVGAQSRKSYRRKFDLEATEFEYPIKEVCLKNFAIRKYPITVEEYEKFVQSEGYQASKEIWTVEGYSWREKNNIKCPRNWRSQIHLRNSPVTGVSWYEANAYCNWLTATLEGKFFYMLPSEAQWEYSYAKCHDLNNLNSQKCNCYMDSGDIQIKTPIGIFPSSTSKNGITDMLGNVEEWCKDSWSISLKDCPTNGTPLILCTEKGAVTRGGSAIRTKRLCRYTYRTRCNKDTRYDTIGFRVIRQEYINGI